MDSLYTSERILISSDACKKLISGGILIDNEGGTIKRIFTSQEEINSYLFMDHGAEVISFRSQSLRAAHSNLIVVRRFMISATKLSCRV